MSSYCYTTVALSRGQSRWRCGRTPMKASECEDFEARARRKHPRSYARDLTRLSWPIETSQSLVSARDAAPKDPGQKSVRIVRTTKKPTIDGIVDPAEWAGAARIDDVYQVNPVEYAPASERTEIYLYYDDDALYIGAIMYQPPETITANMLRQNGSITQDDTLFVTLEPCVAWSCSVRAGTTWSARVRAGVSTCPRTGGPASFFAGPPC